MAETIDRKALFGAIRQVKGAPLTQADVDAVSRVLDGAPRPAGYDVEKLLAELIRDEGLIVGRSYRCTAGKLTAGVGRNLDDNPLSAEECRQLGISNDQARRHGFTRDQALADLRNGVAKCEADLDRRLPWWRGLSDARQRVLLNMCFNLGVNRLLDFGNTLKMIEAGQWSAASVNMLKSLWARQVGPRSVRLAAMMKGEVQ